MTEVVFQARASRLILDFERSFQLDTQGRPDEERLQRYIKDILAVLNQDDSSGKPLLALEKFYQSASFIVGLGNVTLSDQTKQAWRLYDRFHYAYVKPRLTVHGNTRLG